MRNAAICTFLMLSVQLAEAASAEDGKPVSAANGHPDCAKRKAAVFRRAVPREAERRPPAPPSPAPSIVSRAAPPSAAIQPALPAPVTSCDPGGCWDAGGNRYNGATGNTYLDKAGKPCNRSGTWIQCF